MTRENAKKQLIHILAFLNPQLSGADVNALNVAIDALEQEPNKSEIPTSCDDAISRSTAKTRIYLKYVDNAELCKEIFSILDGVPSVQPSRKGHWIEYSDEGFVECPFCEHATTCEDNIEELHYCFYCGAELSADMRGDTE